LKKLDGNAGNGRSGKVTVLDPAKAKNVSAKAPGRTNGEVYLSAKSVQLYPFNEDYFRLLQQDDEATRAHFVSYFSKLLSIKLRSRKLKTEDIHEVQQETFLRVLFAVRKGEIQQPERLGSYVNSVCNNVASEMYREQFRNNHVDLEEVDVPDSGADLEKGMISNESVRKVHAVMARLSDRDRTILGAVLQGRNKDDICRELGVDRQYLRVLMHRAIASFREQYNKSSNRFRQAAKR